MHASWLIAAACTSLFIGVVAARELPLGLYTSFAWLLLGSTLVIFSVWRARVWAVIFALVGGMFIGVWRGSLQTADLALYQQLYGAKITLTGTVSDDLDTNKRGQSVLRLKNNMVAKTHLAGSVWVTTSDTARVQRGDAVVVYGKLGKGFGTFAGTMYSAQVVHVYSTSSGDIALRARNWFAGGVEKATTEPQTSLGLGYLVGERRGLPEDLDVSLKAAGLMHVVVASGYNLTILVRLARRLFEKVSKYLSFLAASGMILAFIAVTGMSPSMSRAGLVAGLSLLAWYYGRRFHPMVLLALAVASTVMVNPSYAWGDVGWQLSFAAFGGVMIVAPLATAYFFGDKKKIGAVSRILIETLAAQVCTLPILLVTFGQISAVAIVANLLILPLVPIAMLCTFVAGIGGLVLPVAARLIGLPAELLLSYMTQTIHYIGTLPWALQNISLSVFEAAIFYVGIFMFCYFMWSKTRISLRGSSLVE